MPFIGVAFGKSAAAAVLIVFYLRPNLILIILDIGAVCPNARRVNGSGW